mgnify:CR=1 FL=1
MKTIIYLNYKNIKHIVFILIIVFFSFGSINCQINNITTENIKVLDYSAKNEELNKIIGPYRNKIKKLEKKIGFSENSLSVRDGELESTLGNFIADVLLKESDTIFNSITSKNIDFCLLNRGGIRGTLNKGVITQHELITIMPFNNTSTVVKLSGMKVLELLQYFNSENIGHPSSGIKIEFKDQKIKKVLIQNKNFDINKSYYVLTSNYLQEGGDKMNFFKNPIELYSLNTNIREVLIKYISKIKIVKSVLDNRIIRSK